MLKKAMILLGLGPDEYYENYDDPNRPTQSHAGAHDRHGGEALAQPGISVAAGSELSDPVLGRTVRPVQIAPVDDGSPDSEGGGFGAEAGVVQPIGTRSVKPHAVSPDAFNDAQEIGDCFKSGRAVIINLQAVDRDLRRRLVDFSSGLCYAMGGKMDRVADQVYLLTPAESEVSRRAVRAQRS